MPFHPRSLMPSDVTAEALNERLRPLGMLAVYLGQETEHVRAKGRPMGKRGRKPKHQRRAEATGTAEATAPAAPDPLFTLLVRRVTIEQAERLAGLAGETLGRGQEGTQQVSTPGSSALGRG